MSDDTLGPVPASIRAAADALGGTVYFMPIPEQLDGEWVAARHYPIPGPGGVTGFQTPHVTVMVTANDYEPSGAYDVSAAPAMYVPGWAEEAPGHVYYADDAADVASTAAVAIADVTTWLTVFAAAAGESR